MKLALVSIGMSFLFAFWSLDASAGTCKAGGVPTQTNSGTLCSYSSGSNTPNGVTLRVTGFQLRGDRYAVVKWDGGNPGCYFDYTTADGKVNMSLLVAAWLARKPVTVVCWFGSTWHDDFDDATHTEYQAVARIAVNNT